MLCWIVHRTGVILLVQAVTDGDQFEKAGPRLLLHDEELWPMAKGMSNLCT